MYLSWIYMLYRHFLLETLEKYNSFLAVVETVSNIPSINNVFPFNLFHKIFLANIAEIFVVSNIVLSKRSAT